MHFYLPDSVVAASLFTRSHWYLLFPGQGCCGGNRGYPRNTGVGRKYTADGMPVRLKALLNVNWLMEKRLIVGLLAEIAHLDSHESIYRLTLARFKLLLFFFIKQIYFI